MRGLGVTGGAGLAYGAMSSIGLAPSAAAAPKRFRSPAMADLIGRVEGSPKPGCTDEVAAQRAR
jgi:monoamine oxidase